MKLSIILADIQRLIIASLAYYSAIKQLLALGCVQPWSFLKRATFKSVQRLKFMLTADSCSNIDIQSALGHSKRVRVLVIRILISSGCDVFEKCIVKIHTLDALPSLQVLTEHHLDVRERCGYGLCRFRCYH